MPFAIAPLILQYGLPLGVKGIEFLINLLQKSRNDPNMTQEEFERTIWLPTQEEYIRDGAVWDKAGTSPNAKA